MLRITLLEWENEIDYKDTTYVDLCTATPKFRKLERAIAWVEKNKQKLLSFCDLEDCVAVDCDIEEWDDDDIIKVVYTTRLWVKNDNTNTLGDFLDDKEKMRDFKKLSKDEFLDLYSYLTEREYDLTKLAYKQGKRA